MSKRAAILLAEGFEEVEALTPADFFHRSGIEVKLLSIENQDMVSGSHDITVKAHAKLKDVMDEKFDVVIAPGGIPGAANLGESDLVIDFIRQKQEEGAIIGAICAAPACVLAQHGFLKTRSYTCNPGFVEMAEKMVGHDAKQERVVVDGSIVTSRAAGTAAEFTHKIIELLLGKQAADEVMKKNLFSFVS